MSGLVCGSSTARRTDSSETDPDRRAGPAGGRAPTGPDPTGTVVGAALRSLASPHHAVRQERLSDRCSNPRCATSSRSASRSTGVFRRGLWILGDLIQLYVSLDPRGYAEEIEQALAELEAELTPQMDSARYLFMFHQLDAAANQDRVRRRPADRAVASARPPRPIPVASTGDHFMVPCYRFLCHHYHLQHDWLEVATCAEAGTDLAQRLGQKQAMAVFQMWQAVVSRQRGAPDKAARLFRSATSRMGRLKMPPGTRLLRRGCAPITNLCGDMDKSLQVRSRGKSRISRPEARSTTSLTPAGPSLRLLVRMGQPLEPHLSAARAVARKFRRPECYLPLIEQIATSGNGPLGEI